MFSARSTTSRLDAMQASENFTPCRRDIDLTRTKNFGIAGFTLHGPFFLKGFEWIDKTIGPGNSLQTVCIGPLVTHTWFRIYTDAYVYLSDEY
jgi:hypothetical protein